MFRIAFQLNNYSLTKIILQLFLSPGLPDENGRIQILNIHTTKMRQYNLLATDVDIKELAVETKNYSGAELEGLVRAAQSTAMNRHIKVRFSLFQGFFDMCIVKTEKRKKNTVHLIRNKYYMNPGAVQVFIMFGLKRFIRCTGSNLHSSLLHTDKKKFSSVKCSAPHSDIRG